MQQAAAPADQQFSALLVPTDQSPALAPTMQGSFWPEVKSGSKASPKSSPWSNKQLAERLEEMIAKEEASASVIASALNLEFNLGNAITRSAVIGRAWRLGQKLRAKPAVRIKDPSERRPRKARKAASSSRHEPTPPPTPRIPAGEMNILSDAYNKWCADLGQNAELAIEALADASVSLPFVRPEGIRAIHFEANPPVPYGLAENSNCKYIVTDTTDSRAMVCGNFRRNDDAYCSFHSKICYQPAATSRLRAKSSTWAKNN